jgi:hypothetical protein
VRVSESLVRIFTRADVRAGTKLSLSQSELAEMAGGTREKVNRCLREWQRQGIIELKNRWTIIRKPGRTPRAGRIDLVGLTTVTAKSASPCEVYQSTA